jgi:rhodanese-related sulfurtransferase
LLSHLTLGVMDDSKINSYTSIGEILAAFPGANRALFSKYHLGGCQSCGFSLAETIAELCARNGDISTKEMIQHLLEAQAHDEKCMVSPAQFKNMLDEKKQFLLLDCRTREEHEAVSIKGSQFLTQDLQQSIFAADPNQEIVIYDHQGKHSLDTCSWFLGHGLKNTRVLRGGIDAWSLEIDRSLPRYQLEIES